MSEVSVPRPYLKALARAPRGVQPGQYCASVSGEAVVFLIGMRVNRWHRFWSWWPTFVAMPQMLKQLRKASNTGFLGARTYWSGRDFMTIQYWRSLEELGAFARSPEFQHLPAWRAFNRGAAGTGDVGIYHETYTIQASQLETLYGNMPPHGLGAAFGTVSRDRSLKTRATSRLEVTEPEYVAALDK